MKFNLQLGNWALQQAGARAVRTDVFIVEQQIPIDLEWDEFDPVSLHAVATDAQGVPVGTGRLLPDGHIGRMAVTKSARGFGIGSAILQALMREAELRGDDSVLLNAQISAERFYRRYGFVREGEGFIEAGIPHICMRHRFDSDACNDVDDNA